MIVPCPRCTAPNRPWVMYETHRGWTPEGVLECWTCSKCNLQVETVVPARVVYAPDSKQEPQGAAIGAPDTPESV